MKDKSLQHPVFSGGHTFTYKPGSTLLNFGDRTRTGVFNVMAVDNKSSIFNIYKEYILKTASTASGKCFNELGQFFFILTARDHK